MKKLLKSMAVISLLALSQVATAGSTGTGTITGYIVYSTGGVDYFLFSTSALSGAPSCNATARFVVSSADPKFKNTTAAVLAAYATQSPVVIIGLGTCTTTISNSEDVYSMIGGSIAY